MDALPTDVLAAAEELGIGDLATDTETSGLFADDGARVSTASIAWEDEHGEWAEWANRWDNVTYGLETIVDTTDRPNGVAYQTYIVSVAWPFDQGTEGKPEDDGQVKLWPDAVNLDLKQWIALLKLLKSHRLVMHNGKFDCEKYRVGVRRWPGQGLELINNLVWDTQNVNDLLWRLHPTSLKPTCQRLFGKEWADEQAVVKRYLQKSKLPAGRWDLMPWDVIGKYADTDSRLTIMLKLRQEWEIEHNDAGAWLHSHAPNFSHPPAADAVYEFIERRLATTKVLYAMERRGVPYDEVTSMEAAIECRRRADEIAKDLPFLPTENKAKAFFFTDKVTDKGVEGLDLVPYAVTDKGAPSLTAEIILRMIDDRVPYAAKWGEWVRVSNAASMWYEGYANAVGQDGRLRTAFRQNGTRSTRFSVERLNLQAIPQDYRLSDHSALDGILTPRQIIALAIPDGWMGCELDLAQAELRVGAMFAKCSRMINMIEHGEDLHTFTTKALFPQISPDDPLFHDKWRQVGKRGNFSLQFGAKGPTFKAMVSKETGIVLDANEADRIVRDWNALYPEYGDAILRHQRKVERRQSRFGYGWIDLYNGERRWFQEYEEAHKAFNQRVQASLAQFGIDWMLLTEQFLSNTDELRARANKDDIGEAGLILTVHDSQFLLLPDDEFGHELAEHCAQLGRDLWKQVFPAIPGDVDYKMWKRPE